MAPASKKDKVLPPVHPNVAVEERLRKRLEALVDEMHNSIMYWVGAAYKANEPEISMALDASPAAELQKTMKRLGVQWEGRFSQASKELAAYFAKAAKDRSDVALKGILKKGGFSVKFKMSRTMNDVLQATIAEQVGLIKSIPDKYLLDVQGAVMRSVQTGHDLKTLSDELQQSFGVTKRRAAFIARDQNNKATANFTRVRQTELGITEAIWRHSGGGRHPRPTHVTAGREKIKYNVAEGWYDPAVDKYILPGELPNCRCVSRSVIPGFI